MKYIAITKVSNTPEYVEPKQYTSDEIATMMATCMFTPIDITENLPKYISIVLSEDTFKFIESVASIDFEYFGEKNYKINGIKFKIYTEEDYIKKYGKIEL